MEGKLLGLSHNDPAIKIDSDDPMTWLAIAVIWGLLVGSEFEVQGTEMLQLWIAQSTIPEVFAGDEFFVPAPESLEELESKSALLYHMWKAS